MDVRRDDHYALDRDLCLFVDVIAGASFTRGLEISLTNADGAAILYPHEIGGYNYQAPVEYLMELDRKVQLGGRIICRPLITPGSGGISSGSGAERPGCQRG